MQFIICTKIENSFLALILTKELFRIEFIELMQNKTIFALQKKMDKFIAAVLSLLRLKNIRINYDLLYEYVKIDR